MGERATRSQDNLLHPTVTRHLVRPDRDASDPSRYPPAPMLIHELFGLERAALARVFAPYCARLVERSTQRGLSNDHQPPVKLRKINRHHPALVC